MAGSSVAAVLPPGAVQASWNQSGERLAVAFDSGRIQVWDQEHCGLVCSGEWQAHEASIVKVVWAPPTCGNVVASCCTAGSIRVWEETSEGDDGDSWTPCACVQEGFAPVLDLQFGNCLSGLKLVAAGGDGHVKVYETTDALCLKQWELQADFPNVCSATEGLDKLNCSAASISWRPSSGLAQQPVFVVGYETDNPAYCAAKVWEFLEVQQRWHPIAELVQADEGPEAVTCVSWAPNMGRPYDLVAVASRATVAIWQLSFPQQHGGRPSVQRVAQLCEHDGEVWEAAWDMAGMTLATSGADGRVKLWQCGFDGSWQAKGIVQGSP